MDSLKRIQGQAIENLAQQHRESLAVDIRKLKRRQQLQIQSIEQKQHHEACLSIISIFISISIIIVIVLFFAEVSVILKEKILYREYCRKRWCC